MADFIYLNFEIFGLGRTAWDSPIERAGVLMGCGLTEILLLPAWVQSGSGPTKSPVQWELGAISARISGQDVKLTAHLHLMPRLLYLHPMCVCLMKCIH